MQYKTLTTLTTLLIGILFITVAFSQSFFNTIMGDEYFSGSARDAALGNHRLTSDHPATLTRSNPAMLSYLDSGFSVHFSISGKSLLEQRSMPMKDMFGDFLETGVYVVNRDQTGYGSLSIGQGFTLTDISFGVGLQYTPLSLFHYRYTEEVRAGLSLDDGIIGNKDPLIGYHTLNSTGKIDIMILGTGFAYRINPAMVIHGGISINMIQPASFSLSQTVQVIQESGTNLSGIDPFNLELHTSSGSFTTLAGNVGFSNGVTLSGAYETSVDIVKSLPDSLITFEPSGLSPELTAYLNGYYLNGINASNITLPARTTVGISFKPRAVVPMEFILEFEYRPYSDNNENIYKDTQSWSVGFEYLASGKMPVRAGYEFNESPIPSIPPETAFTVGTGKQIGRLTLDLSGRYSYNNYNYPDLYTVGGDVRPDLDTVQETRFDVMATFSMEIGR